MCGGYGCLTRLSTFWSTVATNRSYDLTFTATNPQHLRLMLPFGSGELGEDSRVMESSRLLVSIFYSDPSRLDVYWNKQRIPPLESHLPSNNQYNLSMRKPRIDDPCGTNAFASWENKLYVVLCGGVPGVEIKTVPEIVLSLGITLATEDFFDAHYLVRNLASLFGIPTNRMRVPKIVAGSTRRRLAGGGALDVKVSVSQRDVCEDVTCPESRSSCTDGECICNTGLETPAGCTEGDCLCSHDPSCPTVCDGCYANTTCAGCHDDLPMLLNGTCVASCPPNQAIVTTQSGRKSCAPCHASCGGNVCLGPADNLCVECDSVGVNAFLLSGQCVLKCPDGYFADKARTCTACSPTCKTCTGPRSSDCTGCTANACSRTGCPSSIFPSLEVHQKEDIFTFTLADSTHLVMKESEKCIAQEPRTSTGVRQPPRSSPVEAQVGHLIMNLEPGGSLEGAQRTITAIHQTPATGQCVSNCQDGQYTDESARCRKCHLACSTCNGPSDEDCSKPNFACSPGAVRRGRRCVLSCPLTKYVELTSSVVPISSARYKLPGGECDVCANYDCETCDANDPAKCFACKPPPWVRPVLTPQGTCVEGCALTEFHSSNGMCVACDASCASCNGAGSLACTSCNPSSALPTLYNGHCLAACPAGSAWQGGGDGGVCLGCHSTCGSCNAPGDASACTTCTTAAALFLPRGATSGSCGALCPTGEFGADGRCVPCEDGCTRCRASGDCQACSPGFVLKGGKCTSASGKEKTTQAAAAGELAALAVTTTSLAKNSEFDSGYTLSKLGMQTPRVAVGRAPSNRTSTWVTEKQRIIIVGNAPAAPLPAAPPLPPASPASALTNASLPPQAPSPLLPPPMPPAPPPSADTPLFGDLVLSFNGETADAGIDMEAVARYALDYTGAGSDAVAAAALFEDALAALDTIAKSNSEEPDEEAESPVRVALSAFLNESAARHVTSNPRPHPSPACAVAVCCLRAWLLRAAA